jgi:PIN domain nuclease of toxin-antitoxin system
LKVLIDTHCWLWLCSEPERFSRSTLEHLADPETERIISSASVWEIVIKHDIGKLRLPIAPPAFVPSRLEVTRTEVLSISAAHALRVADLPKHHHDPFDRMIVAQAMVEGTPLLTADKALRRYGVELLRV